MRRAALALIAAVAIAAPALAADEPSAVAQHAEGDALLGAAHASDLFDNLTRGDGIILRHKASGLVCLFNPGEPSNHVLLFPGSPRGDDVGCNTAGPAGLRTWYARRARPGESLDDAFAAYVAQLQTVHPAAQPWTMPDDLAQSPAVQMADSPNLPQNRTARFAYGGVYTSVSVAVVGGWVIEFRYSLPLAQAAFGAGDAQPLAWVIGLGQIVGDVPPDGPPTGDMDPDQTAT